MDTLNTTFAGFGFGANGFVITNTDIFSRTPRDLQVEDRAVVDGAILVSSRYRAKPILMEGYVTAPTSTELEAKIDQLHAYLDLTEQALDVTRSGETRRYTATASNVIINRQSYGATMANFSMEFVVPAGFGYTPTESTLLSQSGLTTRDSNMLMIVGGSYKAQPLISITINSLTATNDDYVGIRNPENTELALVYGDFAAGDSVTFDLLNKVAYKNGTRALVSGSFPSWMPGARLLQYTDNFTARNINLVATYNKRWL